MRMFWKSDVHPSRGVESNLSGVPLRLSYSQSLGTVVNSNSQDHVSLNEIFSMRSNHKKDD